jgi:hypothetical protein
MSALGHKQTFAVQKGMSAKCQQRTMTTARFPWIGGACKPDFGCP